MKISDEFFNAIDATLDGNEQLVVIHSSLPHLRPPTSIALQWELMSAIRRLVDRGITVALPTFTFSFCGGKPYHFQNSPSETGILGQWACDLIGFQRTPHPIYSFAVGGPLASKFASMQNSTTFSDDSTFGLCDSVATRIVMVGCGWEYCTQFHRYEELHQTPYRYYKDFQGSGNLGDQKGDRPLSARMFVRDLELNVYNDWNQLISKLQQSPLIKRASLWSGVVESIPCSELALRANQLLEEDVWVFAKDGRQKYRSYRDLKAAQKEPPYKCAILGNSNLANLKKSFGKCLATLLPDRRVEMYAAPFGQVHSEIVAPNSGLKQFAADITFFADRIEDLLGKTLWFSSDEELLTDRVTQYAEMIRSYRSLARGWIVVHELFSSSFVFDFDQKRSAIVQSLNELLKNQLRELDNICFLDVDSIALQSGTNATDARLWHLGRFPFSPQFDEVLVSRWAALVLDALGRSTRLIALDLDNTLWGGILGDDGKSGLKLGGDYPGNAFFAFQQAISKLSQQGIALAIVSKNDEANALDAIATLPGMVLRPEQIAAHRINWNPKSHNLLEICKELSLGVGSVLFIDDNPVERERVRTDIPDLPILELPVDPAEYVQALANCPWLSRLTLTQEDVRRAASYAARAKIQADRSQSTNLESFYESLGMTVHFTSLNENNRSRIQQLLTKTNQFNTTTRRYDSTDLDRMLQRGTDVLSIGLEDKFLAREEIGVIIIDWSRQDGSAFVDSYLLSCRVLGRGLESNILLWVAAYARRRGFSSVSGEIIETERNTPVRSVFRDAGFELSNGEWRLNVSSEAIQVAPWLKVVENLSGNNQHKTHMSSSEERSPETCL